MTKKRKRKINKLRKRFSWKNIKRIFFSKDALVTYAVIAGAFFALVLAMFGWVAKDLPSPDKVNDRLIAQSTIIYASNGDPIWEIHGDKNRTLIDFADMPQYLKDATVAVEDKDFYHHGGFNVKRTVKAFFINVLTKKKAQGGSTITQQLIKNAILSPEKTYTRKVKELILAIEIEQKYTKDEILKMYLNEIPYGSNAYGVEAATKYYFDKKAVELKEKTPENLARFSMLASLPQAPTYFSPYGQNYNDLLDRKNIILGLMAEQGKITKDESLAAKNIDIKKLLVNRSGIDGYGDIRYPHFAMYVKEKLVEKYGEQMATQGGLRVYTTIEPEKEDYALSLLDPKTDQFGLIRKIKGAGASNAALVSLNPTNGNIVAMVGSLDFRDESNDGYVNITTSLRQPGSSIKPLVYANAWKKNWGPGSVLYDLSTDFGGGYRPSNYDNLTRGNVTMRKGLAGSLNIPAVKTLYVGGMKEFTDTAKDLGVSQIGPTIRDENGRVISPEENYGLTMALGSGEVKPIELASAYSTFANMGERHDINWFTRITDSKGKMIDEVKPEKGKQVLNPEIAYMLNDVLSDNNARAFAFGRYNDLYIPGKKVAAKTGTTNAYRDAWTAGYSRDLTTVVWVGNNDNKEMSHNASGSMAAAPIWNAFMKKFADNKGWAKEKPKGIQYLELDGVTGKKPVSGSTVVKDLFPSWYKINEAGGQTSSFKIDKISHKLATDNCPPDAVEEVRISRVTAEIPPTDAAFSRWNNPIAAWASSRGLSSGASFVPTEKCDIHDGTNLPGISLEEMYNNKPVSENFDVKATVAAPRGVSKVVLYVDDKEFAASSIGGSTYIAHLSATEGKHTVQAKIWDKVLYSAVSEKVSVSVSAYDVTLDIAYSDSTNQLTATTNSDKVIYVVFYGIKPGGSEKAISGHIDVSGKEATISFNNTGTYSSAYAIGMPDNVKSNEFPL